MENILLGGNHMPRQTRHERADESVDSNGYPPYAVVGGGGPLPAWTTREVSSQSLLGVKTASPGDDVADSSIEPR
jgi:hypothetical protein